ncbi:MAG TPA: hypothetical protein VL359_18610, partial [bacterium]|nr:hypothetical protein [bacterium]
MSAAAATALRCTAALLVTGLLAGGAPVPARAESLVARQLDLPAYAEQVRPIRWQGQSALMVRLGTDGQVPGLPAGPRLWVVALRGDTPAVQQSWALPDKTRWVEPIALSGGKAGWLGLVGNEWRVGLPQGEALAWQTLCACPSVYDVPGSAPDPLMARFALDLDGDGVDELVLPQRQGLAVFRVWSQPLLAEPLWVDLWNTAGSDLPPLKEDPGYAVPDYRLLAMGPGLQPSLLQLLPAGLAAHVHPEPARWPKALRWDGAARANLRQAALPESLKEALLRLPDSTFPDAQSLAARLTAGTRAVPEDWAGQWSLLVQDLRPAARLPPVVLSLPQLPPRAGDDNYFVLALEDVTGDGVPDVLHAVIHDERQILRTQGELRFYAG